MPALVILLLFYFLLLNFYFLHHCLFYIRLFMKLTAFILLIVIIGSSLFYYGCFDAMLLSSKKEARLAMATAKNNHSLKLVKVPLTRQDAYSSNEIRIDGDLYDVGEREAINDTLYLSLYHDADEQSVLAAIGNFFKEDDVCLSASPNGSSIQYVRIIYNPQFCFYTLSFSFQPPIFKNKTHLSNTTFISPLFCDIITPPPRLC